MLQNARPTAFTVSELLREKQQGGNLPPLTQIKLSFCLAHILPIKSEK